METFFNLAILTAIGWCVYKSGKRIGSRKGYNVGRRVRRQRRRHRRR